MNLFLLWTIQVLILSLGIYVFLRFVQTTRGSRLLRGLVVSLLVGGVGLLMLTTALQLEQLEQILERAATFVVILLAVLFQPELRRGIAQLGEGSFLARLMRRLSRDTVNEIVNAAQSMAARRQGALIAIECESSLEAFVQGGVKMDSAVHRLLLESIFHPGAALHDGAVVIRKDRIAAAACLFPLTENIQIARSTGTRHRAALGLSDETDAVAVAVSEETGQVSVAHHGTIQAVPPSRLEQVLREELGPQGSDEVSEKRGSSAVSYRALLWDLARRDWMWMGVSVLLATMLLLKADQEISTTRVFSVQLRSGSDTGGPQSSGDIGDIVIRPASDNYRLLPLESEAPVNIIAEGTTAQIDRLKNRLSGSLTLESEGQIEIALEDVQWGQNTPGVNFEWERAAPHVDIRLYERQSFDLQWSNVQIDSTLR